MIRGCDHHPVDVGPRQQFAKIPVRLTALGSVRGPLVFVIVFDPLFRVLAPRRVHITHRDDLRSRLAQKPAHQAAPLGAQADKSQIDPLIRRAQCRPTAEQQRGRTRHHRRLL